VTPAKTKQISTEDSTKVTERSSLILLDDIPLNLYKADEELIAR
jgi:hypothetical protein